MGSFDDSAAGGQPPAKRNQTRCITQTEIDGLAEKFAKPPATTPQETCKQTNFQETSNSIDWKMECTGQTTMSNEGSIKFDKLTHYSGTIKMRGNVKGTPVDRSVTMEGHRVGECPKESPGASNGSPAPGGKQLPAHPAGTRRIDRVLSFGAQCHSTPPQILSAWPVM